MNNFKPGLLNDKLKVPKKILLFLLVVVLFSSCEKSKDSNPLPTRSNSNLNDINSTGSGELIFTYSPIGKSIPIWYFTPEDNPAGLPILFVMHGTNRNADVYRDNWIQYSIRHKVLILAPEFSRSDFPGSRFYNLGNMFDDEGNSIPEEKWTFSAIDPIFDFIVSEISGTQTSFDIFGHSAGAQFVHRFLTFKSETKADRFISANAGWYTLADVTVDFPYGLLSTTLTNDGLATAFERELIVLLGEADTIRDDNLRTTAEADAQGPHRFARGLYYFENAQTTASRENFPFNWSLEFAPEVGHSNADIAPFAAEILF